VPLDASRAVVVGSGNVALDVARILSTSPDRLAGTDIADHALSALSNSEVQEVVLLARRGPDRPAYSEAEMRALQHLEGVEVVVDEHDSAIGQGIASDPAGLLQDLPRRRIDYSQEPAPGRRIVIRFLAAAKTILGEDRVEGVELTDGTRIETSVVVSAIGHKGRPIPGLPFDDASGTIPNDHGRVLGLRGSYVVGWIKRGATGGIGRNRADASETVSTLLTDALSSRLPRPARRTRRMFAKAVKQSNRSTIDARGLLKIDAAETARGASAGRPRSKLATVHELIDAAHGR
jgi:ferredoxin--NADP+ reductase